LGTNLIWVAILGRRANDTGCNKLGVARLAPHWYEAAKWYPCFSNNDFLAGADVVEGWARGSPELSQRDMHT
jgi:hypothetical protein